MLNIRESKNEDISALKDTLKESFVQASIEDFGNEKTFPPGVSDGGQIDKSFQEQTPFTILWENKIIGGIIIELKETKDHYLQTLWVIKNYQNKGIGKKAIEYLENKYQDTVSWNLETPKASVRNIVFYEKLGYKKVGELSFDNGKIVLIQYKKEM